jgi:biotin carboxyl carrier protein
LITTSITTEETMTNYRISIADRTYDVSIHDDELEVNGDRIKYDVDSLDGKGLHILRQPHRNIEAHVEANPSGTVDIQIDGNHLNAQVAVGFQSSQANQSKNNGRILSPMPGLIIDIMVKIGDTVKQGETLIIQEAMKMQMKLRSPLDGIITAISTKPGDQVEKGILLVSIQPA